MQAFKHFSNPNTGAFYLMANDDDTPNNIAEAIAKLKTQSFEEVLEGLDEIDQDTIAEIASSIVLAKGLDPSATFADALRIHTKIYDPVSAVEIIKDEDEPEEKPKRRR
jgi:hypothetical protein